MQNNQIITAGGVVAKKKSNGKYSWLLIKQGNEGWEIAKVTARKGESSVRASIRMMGEQGGMNARVLAEAGRFTGTAMINDRTVPKRIMYYLMVQRSGGETLGFAKAEWFEFTKAYRLLEAKREKQMLKIAKQELEDWIKEKKKLPEEDEFPPEEIKEIVK